MKVAVASGKGGTGKTTIATSLALSLMEGTTGDCSGFRQIFIDSDVEGPNAHLFLAPRIERRQEVAIQVPHIDVRRCTACGRCAEVCQYHAIALLGKRTLVFPQLCHGCGSCALVCPEAAISEEPRGIGVLEAGTTPWGLPFAHGVLNIGEPMAAPVIRQLKRWAIPPDDALVIIDAPPGTSCPVVEAVRGSDYVLLVTEPTPFGLHDLRLAVMVARELGIPAGVIINRDGIGDGGVEEFCKQADLPVLLRIPYERLIAEGVALGRTLIEIHPGYAASFRAVYGQIVWQVREHSITRRGGSNETFWGGPT